MVTRSKTEFPKRNLDFREVTGDPGSSLFELGLLLADLPRIVELLEAINFQLVLITGFDSND